MIQQSKEQPLDLSEQGNEFNRLSNLSISYLSVITDLHNNAPLSVITMLRRRRHAVVARMKRMTEEFSKAKIGRPPPVSYSQVDGAADVLAARSDSGLLVAAELENEPVQ